MITLSDVLVSAPFREIRRAMNTNKEYLHFKISVFNVGVAIEIVCTDNPTPISDRTWNGYDFKSENDYYIHEALEAEYAKRIRDEKTS